MAIEVSFQGDLLAPQQQILLRSIIAVGFPSRGIVAVTIVHSRAAPRGKRYTARDAEQRLVMASPQGPAAPTPVTVDVTEKVQGLLEVAERNVVCHSVIPGLDD